MASKKKEELLQPEVQTQAQPAAQSTYSAEGLNSRADVEKAMANAMTLFVYWIICSAAPP